MNILAQLRRDVLARVYRLRRMAARATLVPMLLRGLVLLAALTAAVLAYPAPVLEGSWPLIALSALMPAVAPRTPLVSVFWLITIAAWLVATTLYDETAGIARLAGLATALYVVHSGAALAAVVPYDAVVERVVLIRWALRVAVLAAVGLGLSVFALRWVVRLGEERSYLLASIAGLAATVLLAALLARAWRAR